MIGTTLLLTTLVIAQRLWAHYATKQLNRELAALTAAGEPVSAEDLARESQDIEARLRATGRPNGAVLLQQAMAAIDSNFDSPRASSMVFPDAPPYPPAWHRMMGAAAKHNAAAYARARRARACPEIDWKIPLSKPVFATLLPSLNSARLLANHLADAASYAHVQGDDYEAIERLRDLWYLGRAVDRQPFLISHLVSIGIEALAASASEAIVPGVRISDDDPPNTAPSTTPAVLRPASRRQLRELIATLLDEQDQVQGLRRAFVVERVGQIDMMRWQASNTWVLRPLLDLQTARLIHDDRRLLLAASAPDKPACQAILASMPQTIGPLSTGTAPWPRGPKKWSPPAAPPRYSSIPAQLTVGSLDRVIETDLRIRTDRRLAAISVATQLYRHDHGGAWPAKLEALVPADLPSVPQDPMASGGRALGYLIVPAPRPGGQARPVAYSVGGNGVDDTLRGAHLPAQPQHGWSNAPDEWRDLSRSQAAPATAPAPTTQPPAAAPASGG